MKSVFKFIFGIAGALLVSALMFVTSLVIGRAVTGSWDIREWKKPAPETSAIAAVYEAE